jgi:putative membrane protein
MKRIGIVAVVLSAALTLGCRGNGRDDTNRPAAGDTPAVGTAGERPAADRDRDVGMLARKWVEDRMKDGMTEVKLGELASQKAQSADVKAFGRMMVQDHTKAGNELKQLASKHNITPPADLDDDHRDKVDRLSKHQGAEFDREYINTMVDDHEKTVNALEDRLDKEGDNDNPRYTPKKTDNAFEMELNEWAAKAIPTVRQHLSKAKQLDQKLDRRTTDNR